MFRGSRWPKTWLERHFRVTEAFAANSEDVSIQWSKQSEVNTIRNTVKTGKESHIHSPTRRSVRSFVTRSNIPPTQSGRSCQGHQGRNKTYRNSICTEQVVSSALVFQRNSVPRDSATWRKAFFADTNVTLPCCSGEECRVPVKPGKNSTEPKRHAQTIMAYKFSRMPASCFMTLWKENRKQVSC